MLRNWIRAILVCVLVTCSNGCAALTAHEKASILSNVEQMACVILHETLPDAKAIQFACGLADDVVPEIERYLASSRKAATVRAAHLGCP